MLQKLSQSAWHLLKFVGLLCGTDWMSILLRASPDLSAAVQQCVQASLHGDMLALRQLLAEYGNGLVNHAVNTPDYYGPTPLLAASFGGSDLIVQLLLDVGADVNQVRQADRATALYAAAQGGHEAVVQILLKANAQVDQKGPQGETALLIASDRGHEAIVRSLLSAGASANMARDDGLSVLFVASQAGHVSIVRMLLDAGAEINGSAHGCKTALSAASFKGNVAVVQLLLEQGATVDVRESSSGCTALYLAAQEGHMEIVQLLLSVRANANCSGPHRTPALVNTSEHGHVMIVDQLLAAGADCNATDVHGRTALMAATQMGHGQVAERLLYAGGDPDIKDVQGKPILEHLCVFKVDAENDMTDQTREQELPKLQRKCTKIARLLFERGLSQYTQEQLDTPGISLAEAKGFVERLHSAFESGCEAQVAGIGRYTHFPPELRQLVGSFVGGSIGQVR